MTKGDDGGSSDGDGGGGPGRVDLRWEVARVSSLAGPWGEAGGGVRVPWLISSVVRSVKWCQSWYAFFLTFFRL